MDDQLLVEQLLDGDPRGLAGVYDTYASRLYAYSVSLLHDRDLAADIVHDTLLIARERVVQLRDPGRLRPWLYAIARNECLRALRDRRRTTDLDEAGQVTDQYADLEAGVRAGEMSELVWAAAASLNPREREVLELSVRHGLEGADLADALGVPSNHAHALMSKARAQLELALSVLIVARTGRQDCVELDSILGHWDGVLTPLLRKRIGKHIQRCEICGEQRRRRVSAAALLSGMPLLVAPPLLRERVLRDANDMRLVAMWAELAANAGPYRPDGFPVAADRPRRGFAIAWAAVGAAALILLIVGGLVVLPSDTPKGEAAQTVALGPTESSTDQLSTTDSATETPSDTSTTPSTTPSTTTPSETTSSSEEETTSPSTTPTSTTVAPPPTTPPTTTRPTTTRPTTTRPTTSSPTQPTDPPPAPPGIKAGHSIDPKGCPEVAEVTLTATVSNANPRTVFADITVNGQTSRQAMTGSGANWSLFIGRVPGGTTVSWTASAVGGGQQLTAKDPDFTPCPPGEPPG